ncbi:hypothetical protein [Halorubrum lipolyticum]|uniref:hypothetical protein n=1 Tax=Halorubrum lipolyticum TaxID=368624 RepID=UPI0011C7844A|nr:hypothetical protein [Halorubrum lipolyticum]
MSQDDEDTQSQSETDPELKSPLGIVWGFIKLCWMIIKGLLLISALLVGGVLLVVAGIMGTVGPLLVMEGLKVLSLTDDIALMTDYQILYIIAFVFFFGGIFIAHDIRSVLETIVGNSAAESIAPIFETGGFLLALVGAPVYLIALPLSVYNLGNVLKELFPEYSWYIYVAQMIFVLLVGMALLGDSDYEGSSSSGSQSRDPNYSKTSAWYFFYK